MTFEVVVDHETLHVSLGPAVARMHVVAGEECFPERGWWDFPCVVLGWWLSALEKHQRFFELQFMDGPAIIDVVVADDGVATLTAKFETSTSPRICWSADVSLEELSAAVYRAAELLVRACELRGVPTDGLERLLPAR